MKRLARIIVSAALLSTALVATSSPASASHWGYEETINRPDLHQGHADVLRLYWAFFDRQPEYHGADYWIRAYDSCDWGSDRIAQFFSVSPEFEATYGDPTDEEFIELVYGNVFDRAPDAGGAAFWLGRLTGGQTRGSMVADLAFSPEFRTAHPLPSDGVANTGCESTDSAIYDPVSLLVAFSEAWDTEDYVSMAEFSIDSVIPIAESWWEAPNPGVVSAIDAAEAHVILADCYHPASLETACEFSVGEPGGGPGRPLFSIVWYESEDDGLMVVYLEHLGDGSS